MSAITRRDQELGVTRLVVCAPAIRPLSEPVYWIDSCPPAFAAAAGSACASRQRPSRIVAL